MKGKPEGQSTAVKDVRETDLRNLGVCTLKKAVKNERWRCEMILIRQKPKQFKTKQLSSVAACLQLKICSTEETLSMR